MQTGLRCTNKSDRSSHGACGLLGCHARKNGYRQACCGAQCAPQTHTIVPERAPIHKGCTLQSSPNSQQQAAQSWKTPQHMQWAQTHIHELVRTFHNRASPDTHGHHRTNMHTHQQRRLLRPGPNFPGERTQRRWWRTRGKPKRAWWRGPCAGG